MFSKKHDKNVTIKLYKIESYLIQNVSEKRLTYCLSKILLWIFLRTKKLLNVLLCILFNNTFYLPV